MGRGEGSEGEVEVEVRWRWRDAMLRLNEARFGFQCRRDIDIEKKKHTTS